MSSCPPLATEAGKHECENCGWEGDTEDLQDICDLWQRLTPGGVVPSGQCPECQALVYPVPEKKPKKKEKKKKEPYPEHVKLKLVQKQSQKCGEFFEWLLEEGYVVVEYPKRLQSMLAEFFEIDEDKLEKEKRAMIDACRQMNKRKAGTVG